MGAIGKFENNKRRLSEIRKTLKRISNRPIEFFVGKKVWIRCMTGFGEEGSQTVTKITKRFDTKTGKGYDVIWFGKHSFDSRTGRAISPPTADYIQVKTTNK